MPNPAAPTLQFVGRDQPTGACRAGVARWALTLCEYGVDFDHQRSRFIDSLSRHRHSLRKVTPRVMNPTQILVDVIDENFKLRMRHTALPLCRRERKASLSHRRPLAVAGDVWQCTPNGEDNESILCPSWLLDVRRDHRRRALRGDDDRWRRRFAKAQRQRTPGSARAAAPGLKPSKVRHSGDPSSLAKAGDP
jgi:hypothetical protein